MPVIFGKPPSAVVILITGRNWGKLSKIAYEQTLAREENSICRVAILTFCYFKIVGHWDSITGFCRHSAAPTYFR